MMSRIRSLLLAGSVIGGFAGCHDPEMVPVAPPGVELQRAPKIKDGEGAQAIGEQGLAETPRQNTTSKVKQVDSPPTPIGKPVKTASGLVYETLKEGTGPTAKSGQMISIHYTGTLASDGTQFDSSRNGNPFPVQNRHRQGDRRLG